MCGRGPQFPLESTRKGATMCAEPEILRGADGDLNARGPIRVRVDVSAARLEQSIYSDRRIDISGKGASEQALG